VQIFGNYSNESKLHHELRAGQMWRMFAAIQFRIFCLLVSALGT